MLGGLMHRRPGQRGVRVEIEDDAIGPLESWKARAPRMKFVCAVLHGAHDVRDIGEAHEWRRFFVVVARAQRMLLKKTVVEATVHALHDRDRTRRELAQKPWRQRLVIPDDVELGMAGSLEYRPFRIADCDPRDPRGRRPGSLGSHRVPFHRHSSCRRKARTTRKTRNRFRDLNAARHAGFASFTGCPLHNLPLERKVADPPPIPLRLTLENHAGKDFNHGQRSRFTHARRHDGRDIALSRGNLYRSQGRDAAGARRR